MKKKDLSMLTVLLLIYNVALAIVILTTYSAHPVSLTNPWVFLPPAFLIFSAYADMKGGFKRLIG